MKSGGNEPKMLGAHPEHYIIYPTEDSKGIRFVETIGKYVTYAVLPALSANGDSEQDRDLSYPAAMIGNVYMQNGSLVAEVLYQFRDHEDGVGFDALLSASFPQLLARSSSKPTSSICPSSSEIGWLKHTRAQRAMIVR
jgi:hypothetical protein